MSIRCSPGFERSGLAREDLQLRQRSGASLLVGLAVDEVAFQAGVVVDIGMYRGELLELPHSPETQHRPLPSSERQVAVLDAVVGPTAHLLLIDVARSFTAAPYDRKPSVVTLSGAPCRLSAFFMKVSAASLSRVLVM